MKKWYVIIVALAVLWLVSLPACLSSSAEVDRLKDEVAELEAELDELQSSYDNLLSEYNELKGGTSTAPEDVETSPPETLIEKLPYSWAEGVFLITIEEFYQYDEPGWGENYDWYRLRVSYKNTSHRTTKADINIGNFKLKTGKGNIYDMKYVGCESCYDTFDPEATHDYPPCTFRIQKGEKPIELWFYENIGEEYGPSKYAEEPSIIFRLET